ncbi:MAG: amidohydrolase family protein [Calditrichae bacterium]|nr:amidohydrolase family protein [Calditrichia bacterium]
MYAGLKHLRSLFVLIVLAFSSFSNANTNANDEDNITIIKCGTLIDGVSDAAKLNKYILIKDNIITAIKDEIDIPESATLIDLSSCTVLPGLIDAHTHICLNPEDEKPAILYKSIPFRTLEGAYFARKTLEAGFTTLRDMDSEGAGFADVAIRDAIDQGLMIGPRLQVSTLAISITGGHMNIKGLAPGIDVPQEAAIADTPEEKLKQVRYQIKHGANWIKIYTTGTTRHINPKTFEPLTQMSLEEVKMIVEEAKRWDVPVAAHAYGGDGAANAILGGVRSIEHGFFLSDDQLQEMAKRGTYWIPTIKVYIPESEARRNEPLRKKILSSHQHALQKAMDLGVKIAFGTDAGAYTHAANADEFEVMVGYGMSPMQAIKSATIVAAELMRLEDRIGSIEPGKYADIIAVKSNPLKDISALKDVSFVMKNGIVYKNNY